MKELEKKRNRTYISKYKNEQWKMDREKKLHSPELYAVWNLKHYLIQYISQLNPYGSKFFIYTDSGAWRKNKFTRWPDEQFVRSLAGHINDRILYGLVSNSINVKRFPDVDLIQGKLVHPYQELNQRNSKS